MWFCSNNATNGLKFGWFSKTPNSTEDCLWMNVKELRDLIGAENFDKALEKHLTIMTETPLTDYPTVNVVWQKFGKVFSALFSLLSYVPVAKDYFYQGKNGVLLRTVLKISAHDSP